MATHDCESEIMELKSQIEKLMSQQITQQGNNSGQKEPHAPTGGLNTAAGDISKIRESLEDFMDLLEQDLKQVPVTTAVAIFGLGVLFGRLLPR